MRPDERLPRKRTGSSGSRVPPAVTSTRAAGQRPAAGSQQRLDRGGDGLGRLASRPIADLALGELALLRADEHRAARAQRARRWPASRGAPTCARSSPARPPAGPPRRARSASARCRPGPRASFASVLAEHGATTHHARRARGVEVRVDRPPGTARSVSTGRRERPATARRADEALGVGRRRHLDAAAAAAQQPHELARPVGGDAARDADAGRAGSRRSRRPPRGSAPLGLPLDAPCAISSSAIVR